MYDEKKIEIKINIASYNNVIRLKYDDFKQ
jgi:hypothetical protein